MLKFLFGFVVGAGVAAYLLMTSAPYHRPLSHPGLSGEERTHQEGGI